MDGACGIAYRAQARSYNGLGAGEKKAGLRRLFS